MQTRTPMSGRRAMNPSWEARIVNQVGSPWMLEGKRFLPETGIPIWKIARIRMLFDDIEPEPLAVATWIEKSLTTFAPPPARSEALSSRTRLKSAPFPTAESTVGTRDDTKASRVRAIGRAVYTIAGEGDFSMKRVLARCLVAAAALACVATCAAAEAGRPFRFDELARVQRVGAFSLSPDGKWIVYSVGTPDVEANRTHSALWI